MSSASLPPRNPLFLNDDDFQKQFPNPTAQSVDLYMQAHFQKILVTVAETKAAFFRDSSSDEILKNITSPYYLPNYFDMSLEELIYLTKVASLLHSEEVFLNAKQELLTRYFSLLDQNQETTIIEAVLTSYFDLPEIRRFREAQGATYLTATFQLYIKHKIFPSIVPPDLSPQELGILLEYAYEWDGNTPLHIDLSLCKNVTHTIAQSFLNCAFFTSVQVNDALGFNPRELQKCYNYRFEMREDYRAIKQRNRDNAVRRTEAEAKKGDEQKRKAEAAEREAQRKAFEQAERAQAEAKRRAADAEAQHIELMKEKLKATIGKFTDKKSMTQAFRKWSLLNHPDKRPGNDEQYAKVKELYEEILKLLG